MLLEYIKRPFQRLQYIRATTSQHEREKAIVVLTVVAQNFPFPSVFVRHDFAEIFAVGTTKALNALYMY